METKNGCSEFRNSREDKKKLDSFGQALRMTNKNRHTEAVKPKYLINIKEILRSLCSLRMTWGKGVNIFSLSKGEGQSEGFITNLRKELINKPSPAFVVFANAQTQLLPLTKREGNKKRKELINLSTYQPINL